MTIQFTPDLHNPLHFFQTGETVDSGIWCQAVNFEFLPDQGIRIDYVTLDGNKGSYSGEAFPGGIEAGNDAVQALMNLMERRGAKKYDW
jgi:hypothetical protein